MRTRLALTLAIALIALAAPAAASGASFQKSIWGPYLMAPGQDGCSAGGPACSAFPVYRELGVDVYQFQIHWDEVAPSRPQHPRSPSDPAYDWGEVDWIVQEARNNRIGLTALVQRSPRWANGGRSPIWVPRRPRDFANFLAAAAKRYPYLRRWMIWGEPARAENFQPMRRGNRRGPRRYAKLLDLAYAALKHVSRRNVVIGGNTLNGGTIFAPDFIHWMKLPNGRPPRMDLWGHNPFDARFPRLADKPLGHYRGFNDIDTLHREIRKTYRKGHRKVPRLWLSEWTIVSDHPLPLFSGFYVSRKGQAQRLKAAFRIARRTRYIAGMGWFTLLDEPQLGESVAGWGLLDTEGVRKPSFWAYKRLP